MSWTSSAYWLIFVFSRVCPMAGGRRMPVRKISRNRKGSQLQARTLPEVRELLRGWRLGFASAAYFPSKANRARKQSQWRNGTVRCLEVGMFPAALDTMLPMNSEPLIVEQDEQGILRLHGPLTMENLASFQSALRRGNPPILFLDLSEG